jgi:hypothetical protein
LGAIKNTFMTFKKSLSTFIILVMLFVNCSTEKKENLKDTPINSLEDVLLNLGPINKKFYINPNEETLLKGDKGTAVYIPADAFQFADGTSPKGKVKIELKECYLLTDMIAENMNTTSGHQILETGGMVYFNATADGKQLSVKDGKAFVVGFPKGSQTKEMDLFYDFALNDSSSTWVPDYEIFKAEAMQDVQAKTTPSEGDKALNLEYPIEMTDDLYDYFFSTCLVTATFYDLKLKGENRTILDYISDPSTIDDSIVKQFVKNNWRVHFDLNIDKNGKMVNLIVKNDEYTKYNQYAHNSAKDFLLNAPPFDLTSDSVEVEHDWIYSLGLEGSRQLNLDRFKSKFRGQFSEYKNKAIQQLDKTAMDYYMFSVTKMGWINCDRFWDINEEQKTDFFVTTQSPKETKIQIVFKDINSIMTGIYKDEKFVFENVPLGRQVKVIGISYLNGKPTMGVSETTIDKDGFELNAFKEFTLDDLEKELNGKK